MPLLVPDRPAPFPLAPLAVGRPVARAHGQRLNNDLVFLMGHNVQTVADCSLDYDTGATSPLDLSVFYTRSPGAQALLLGLELMEADGAQATCTWTLNGAPLAWLQANGLDGARALAPPPANSALPQMYWGVADVSAVPADGTLQILGLNYVRTAAAKGVRRIFVREVPQAQVDPAGAPTTEVGFNPAWPAHRPNPLDAPFGLVDGSATDALGWVRVLDQLEQARTLWRAWRQSTHWEFDTFAPQRSSAVIGAFTWPIGGTYTPTWVTRAQRHTGTTAGTAQPEQVNAVVRYRCGGGGGTIRLIVDGANNDFVVPAAAGYVTRSLGTVSLKTSAAGQRSTVQMHGAVATTGTLYVPTIAFYRA